MRALILTALAALVSSATIQAAGPIVVANSDSTTVVRLQLATQLWTVWESEDPGGVTERDPALSMRAKRVRPSFTVTLPKYHTDFRLLLSAAPGSLELMDMYLNSRLSSNLSVRFGQYKVPFTRYRIQSLHRLTFVDWSIVSRYFGAERQLGLTVHNGYDKPPRLAYALGLFTGVGMRASHAVGLATAYGEELINYSDLTGSATNAEFHPELIAHLSFNAHGIDVKTDSDPEGGGLRYTLAASVAWDLDPNHYEDFALRIAPEVLMKYRHFSMTGVGYAAFEEIDCSQRTRLALSGFLLQSAWRASGLCEFSLRYALVDIDGHVADVALERAAAIVDGTDDPEVVSQYKNAGKLLSDREGTVGFNLYLDDGLRMQNDFGITRHEFRDEDRTDYLFRSQIQLMF